MSITSTDRVDTVTPSGWKRVLYTGKNYFVMEVTPHQADWNWISAFHLYFKVHLVGLVSFRIDYGDRRLLRRPSKTSGLLVMT